MSSRILLALALVAPVTARADDSALPGLLARTDQLAKEVAKVRGLRLKHAIPNEVIDRTELHTRLVALAGDDKTAAATAAEGLAMKRWGLVPFDFDYTGALVDLLSDQIAGYYDTKTKKLTILDSAGSDPDWAEMVFAHELDHGLQDQAFDLEKFEKLPDDATDAAIARHALVEGDGVALMLEVLLAREGITNPWHDPEASGRVLDAMLAPVGDTLDKAPLAIRAEMLFPYHAGFAFVAALRRHQPWSAIDAAFRRPPKSTEQILHVDKYLADDQPIAIAAATPASLTGLTLVHSGVWGELGFATFLDAHGIGTQVASEASAGWGGDRALLFAHEGDPNARHATGLVRSEWDTEADAMEAQAALERAVDDLIVGATVEHTGLRVRWLALDGTVAWVERRGTGVMLTIGVPAYDADALAAEAWTVITPKRQTKR